MDDSLVKISSRSAAGKTLSEQIEKERELQKRMANKLELKKKILLVFGIVITSIKNFYLIFYIFEKRRNEGNL